MNGKLDGKVCIITGSGGSIGRASALAFAREGARVVGCDIAQESGEETVALVREAGGEMIGMHPCDLTDPAAASALVDLAVGHFGRLDVLFNNAGAVYFGWMSDMPIEDWHKTISHELDIVFLLTRAAWRALGDAKGVVLNTASIAGLNGVSSLGSAGHAAAKGGIIALTRQLAVEGRTIGVRANCLSPGPIGTPAVLAKANDPEWLAAQTRPILRGTFGEPEEIATAAVFMVSDDSSFVNGTNLVVDGGYTAW